MAVRLADFAEPPMTMAEVEAMRRGKQLSKPVPHQIAKQDKAKDKKKTDEAFRASIWKLDEGKSRATGTPLVKSGTTDWHKLGEVDHAIQRSLAPELIYESSNAILLSKWENRMRKVPCTRAPEFKYFDYTGPENRRLKQTFVWRNDDGKVVKTRKG